MTTISAHSRPGQADPGRDTARRSTAAIGLCTIAVTLVAGCSTTAAALRPLPARQALSLAAQTSQQINSMAASVNVQVAGATEETTAGTIRIQLKPALLTDTVLNISASGHAAPVEEILTSKDIYIKIAQLARVTGKPWLRLSFASLSGKLGASFGQLLQNLEAGNPLNQTRMLAASKNVRVVGSQVIDGVRTTHYAGTYTAAGALAELSPDVRQVMTPMLKTLTGDIRFNTWIDARHVARKLVVVETASGARVTTTLLVTAINQPVTVTLPPSGQVAVIPAGLLNGSGSAAS